MVCYLVDMHWLSELAFGGYGSFFISETFDTKPSDGTTIICLSLGKGNLKKKIVSKIMRE
jgi:hypothetical protein